MATSDAKLSQARAELEGKRNVLLSALAAHDTALATAIADLDDMLARFRDMRAELRETRRVAAEIVNVQA